MPYSFIRDVPFNEDQYGEIRSLIGDEPPKGLITHLAIRRDGGLRYIDVWDTQADWERFRDVRVSPAVQKVMVAHGLAEPSDPLPMEMIDIIDAMVGPTPVEVTPTGGTPTRSPTSLPTLS